MMRKLYSLLISLWTLEGTLALTIAVCLAGSLMLPSHLAFFSGIDETPLFEWLREAGEPGNTWWIYAMVFCFGLLGVTTALCTLDSLLKLKGRRDILARLFPQLMHIGILLVMLGHLLTAWQGDRFDLLLEEGQSAELGGGYTLGVLQVGLGPDVEKEGYYDDWQARLLFTGDSGNKQERLLKPVSPVNIGGNSLFFRSITLPMKDSDEKPSALIRVVRDPGVAWALSGAVLLVIGGIGFLSTRGRAASSQ
jgi:cytochrome c biogenesis factor